MELAFSDCVSEGFLRSLLYAAACSIPATSCRVASSDLLLVDGALNFDDTDEDLRELLTT
jgi:hypothetical protein